MKSQEHTSQKQHIDLNKERQRGQCRDMEGVGRWALSIPHEHKLHCVWPLCLCIKCLVREFPELDCKDKDIQNKAWLKFIKSSNSIAYRVSDKL